LQKPQESKNPDKDYRGPPISANACRPGKTKNARNFVLDKIHLSISVKTPESLLQSRNPRALSLSAAVTRHLYHFSDFSAQNLRPLGKWSGTN